MLQFLDLPLEILPAILFEIVKPHHLASCCLVNKLFLSFAIPQLYERIYIYAWHKQGKAKVTRLFKTLSENPKLARWVKKLELRDFPQAHFSESYQSLSKTCLLGLSRCTSLRSCTWTRDQTLSTEILEVLSSQCPELRELEINGHATGTYDPQALLRFNSLTKLSLIMPSADVIDILPTWIEKTSKTLDSFHVTCKSSSLITDSTLERVALSMKGVKHLHIAGCPRVTHKGIIAILANKASTLKSLGLEGLSAVFDLDSLARNIPFLVSLNSLTLTLPPSSANDTWCLAFLTLTKHSPLNEIHLYMMGGYTVSDSQLFTPKFMGSFLECHASQLHKFSVHRLRLQSRMVGTICASCPKLESLFVVVDGYSLVCRILFKPSFLFPDVLKTNSKDELVPELALSRSLRNIHINFPHTANNFLLLLPSEVLAIAKKLGPRVRQLGFSNRVYQIDRVVTIRETGEIIVEMALAPYERPEVPEQFLVVRT